MKKKVLSLCLALALCAGLTIPAVAAEKLNFKTPGGSALTLSQPAEDTVSWNAAAVDQDGVTWTGEAYRIPFGTTIAITPSEYG